MEVIKVTALKEHSHLNKTIVLRLELRVRTNKTKQSKYEKGKYAKNA